MSRAPEEDVVIVPADLYEDILLRLPTDDLLNLKRVCKDWQLLISSPEFIQKHLERSKAKPGRPRTSKKVSWIHNRYLGTCDGLVLYHESSSHKIVAFNPSTGKRDARLRGEIGAVNPYPGKNNEMRHPYSICSWFGRHPNTGEYVLVLAFLTFGRVEGIVFNVYSLSGNSLLATLSEESGRYNSRLSSRTLLFLHGKLHVADTFYCRSRESEILAYDLQTNTMLRMCVPRKECQLLGVVDGCLCAFDWHEVWMMKEYGVRESWIKYAKIDDRISICRDLNPDEYAIVKASRYGESPATYLIGCCLRNRRVECIDTLVSPAVVWEKRE